MNRAKAIIWNTEAGDWSESIPLLLDAAGLADSLAGRQRIVIKPNLVEALEPPITTPIGMITVLVDYLVERRADIEIIIGEGTGSLSYDTFHCYRQLGYLPLADRARVKLLDLNTEPCRRLHNASCRRWPEMYLPEILFDTFLISVPVLKAHSLAHVTLTMKNMMGCAPPAHYRGAGAWGKSSFHHRIDEAIFDLNRYRTPDFTLLDASVGMAQAHLWGPTCSPAVGKIAASYDPVAIDAYGCQLLKRSWLDVGHIKKAHHVLGSADPLDIRTLHDIKRE